MIKNLGVLIKVFCLLSLP